MIVIRTSPPKLSTTRFGTLFEARWLQNDPPGLPDCVRPSLGHNNICSKTGHNMYNVGPISMYVLNSVNIPYIYVQIYEIFHNVQPAWKLVDDHIT